MLVVVAIVALLAAVVFNKIGVARARARDARREADIKSLQTALTLYNSNKGAYPPSTGYPYGPTAFTNSDQVSLDLKNENSISKISPDPLNSNPYIYSYETPDGSTYTIRYALETNSIPGKSQGAQQAGP